MATGNGTITVDIDPTKELPERYLGSDEDGPRYGSMTLYDAIAEAAANQIVGKVEKKLATTIAERVNERIGELVDAKIPVLFEEALTEQLVVTDNWGGEREKGTLRELIVKQVQSELTVSSRNSYGETALDKVIKEHITYGLTGELSKAVEAAKADLVKKLRDKASEVMADTITKAVR